MNRWTTLSTDASLQVLKCAFTPNERLLELIIASCRDFNFQKNLLSQGPGFSLEEALRLRRTYEAKASQYPVAQAGQYCPTGNVQEADVPGRQAAVVLPGASHSTEEVARAAHDSQAHSVQRHHHPLLWDLELPKQVPTVSVGGHRIPHRRCPRSSCHRPTLKRKPQDRDTPLQRNDRS